MVVTHILNQRGGEKMAQQVRDDLAIRLSMTEKSLSDNIAAVDRRLAEFKTDFKAETADRFGRLDVGVSDLHDEIRLSKQELKELFRAELKAGIAEIRSVVSERMRRAGDAEAGSE